MTNMPEDHRSPLVCGASHYYLLCLSISGLIFFCMNSSLACADILIPPPNPPQHIYLRELIKSLSSHFPSHCVPSYFPFSSLITKDMVIIAGGGKGQKEVNVFAKYKPRSSACLPPLSGLRDLILRSVIDTLLTQVSCHV